ncbi:MAG TPA: hypothetical protein VGO00_02110 [Kofleriaceae bacterium]|nr:hypothetical protein [Kofleriaceae bacterium]
MKLAFAALVLAACDAQVDGTYAGEPLVVLHGSAIGFSSGEVTDGAAIRWNTQVGSDLTAGPTDPLPLATRPPSDLTIGIVADPSDDVRFGFDDGTHIAEGTLFLTDGDERVGEAIAMALVYVTGEIAPGSLAAGYLGGMPAPGYHLCDVRATAELTDAQAYFAAKCGSDDACRQSRLYRLAVTSDDLATTLQFFQGAR